MIDIGCPTCSTSTEPEVRLFLFGNRYYNFKCRQCGSQTQFFRTIGECEVAWNKGEVVKRKRVTEAEYRELCRQEARKSMKDREIKKKHFFFR